MAEIKTLVELFDECQMENVIASLRFRPERIIFVGYNSVMTDKRKAAIKRFFETKGIDLEIAYKHVSRYRLEHITNSLNSIIDTYEDCVFDITGGKELALMAIGAVSAERNVPVIQFSAGKGCFVNVSGDIALPAGNMPALTVSEIVTLNGGAVLRDEPGDFEWSLDADFVSDIEKIWDISKANNYVWNRQSRQFASFERYKKTDISLAVRVNLGDIRDAGGEVFLDQDIIKRLKDGGLIKNYRVENDILTFTYKNRQVRECVIKAGNTLELYAYALLTEIGESDKGYYDDIDIGVYVDWDGKVHARSEKLYDTRNEMDIIVMRDTVPIFISCKNGEVKKEALYELDTVANHFGGEYAKKILLTTNICPGEESRRYLMQRARDMRIDVIDGVDKLTRWEFVEKLKSRVK